jgi:integrase
VNTVKAEPGRRVLVWDTGVEGLVLAVEPTGAKSWKVIYPFRGRTRWFTIGKYGSVIGLAEARKRARKVLLQVADGIDVQADRMAQRDAGTFEELATRYVDEYAKKRNKSWRQGKRLIDRYVLPRWGRLSAAEITRSDARRLFASIEAPVLANQVLRAASPVFTWAIKNEIGRVLVNPCTGIEENKTRSRERVLSDTEVALFWPRLSPALKILLLTGQRPGEVEAMREDQLIDGWWELPGPEIPELKWPGTKNGLDHRVWLSEPVRALLPDFFASKRTRLDEAMRKICAALGIEKPDKVTPHDLRRTNGSAITGLGFGRDAMNRIQNHVEGGIADVYDRHGYAEENKRIMETVAQHFVALAGGGDRGDNVVEWPPGKNHVTAA